MTSKLMLHKGAVLVSRKELAEVKTPEPTETWQPIAHIDLLKTILAELTSRGVRVIKEELAIQRRGEYFYGVLDVAVDSSLFPNHTKKEQDCTASLAFRSSNNRKLSIQIAAGARVFVCDNLAFQGDLIVLKRRHTQGLELELEIAEAIDMFGDKYGAFVSDIQSLKKTKISDEEAKCLIFDAFREGVLPNRCFAMVSEQYFEPEFEDFEKRNLWSLQNAFTYAAKDLAKDRRFKALTDIGVAFQRIAHNEF